MASYPSNKIKYLLATKTIDFSADVFKIILMASGFTFDVDAHHIYGDVSGSELGEAYGYTTGGNTLGGVTVTEDDTNDRTSITWDNSTWTASAGTIGPSPGAVIYDNTVGSPVKPIVGFIDFGGEQSQADGGVCTIANIEFRIA